MKKSIEKLAKIVEKLDQEKYVLRLYVTGMTPKSTLAIDNVQRICEKYLEGFYELKIIDIYQQPKLAKEEQIIATPTLIKQLPLPIRKLIGDMSDTERCLAGIDLKTKETGVRRQESEDRIQKTGDRRQNKKSSEF